jgi:superfamily II DNA or RNA helicase
LPAYLEAALADELSFTKRTFAKPGCWMPGGYKTGPAQVSLSNHRLYDFDEHGRLLTFSGLSARIVNILREHGCEPGWYDLTPARPAGTYDFDWNAVRANFSFRPRQEEAIQAVIQHRQGIIEAPTGFGKMALIAMLCLGFGNARIDVVTRRTRLVKKLVRYLSPYMEVGQVGAGAATPVRRVTICTADSMHRLAGDADILLCDEGHELGGDSHAEQLARWRLSRAFMFSASPEGRFDGCDIRLEALFGRRIFQMKYPEAVSLGLVVPIEVNWSDVELPYDPASSCSGLITRKRHGVWRNIGRNQIIARSLEPYRDLQTLVLVETLEHAVHLRSFLPGYELAYANEEEKEIRRYQKTGLLSADHVRMTGAHLLEMETAFEAGQLLHVIATGVWAVGVDFTRLQVLARADAGRTETASIQQPGRLARVRDGKECGILLDYRDQFNRTLAGRATERMRHYRKMGWTQSCPDEESS